MADSFLPYSSFNNTFTKPVVIATNEGVGLTVTGGFSTDTLAVTSTTKVTNLNADTLDGTDWRAPGAIGGVTPASITGSQIISTGYIQGSVGNALTAAGTNQATGLQLAATVNNVTTAAASTGVILPSAATAGIGAIVYIYNAGASAIKVYGAGSDTIDATAGATGVTLTNTKRCAYTVVAAATWISAQLGVVSA